MAAAVLLALPSRSILGKRKAAPSTFHFVHQKIDDSATETGSDTDSIEDFSSVYSESDSPDEDEEDVEQNKAGSESDVDAPIPPSQSNDIPDLSLSRLRVQGGGTPASSSRTSLALVNGKLVQREKGKRAKRYTCTWPGCEKAYTKPVRLEEHARSHTGDRPYKCTECGLSYMRDTHLAAHTRTHRPDSDKPFLCSDPACGKRFWTSSQLKVHTVSMHQGVRPFVCGQCEQRFAKHAQLRRHEAETHAPEGTKVFRCAHEGCGKSFAQSAKLRAHERKHDPDRYVCSHPSCTSTDTIQFFQTWSALQAHIREAHPPTCPYKMCRGKVFKTKGNLKAHMKMHEEEGHRPEDSGDESDLEDDRGGKRLRRKSGGEWKCDSQGCRKSFREKSALKKHKQTAHLGLRPFKCSVAGCDYSCGYKHVLQKHTRRHHPSPSPGPAEEARSIEFGALDSLISMDERIPSPNMSQPVVEQPPPEEDIIALLTGISSAPSAALAPPTANRRTLHCPYPDLLEHPFDPENGGDCSWSGSRVYDLWRHLRTEHAFECERVHLEEWVKEGGRR